MFTFVKRLKGREDRLSVTVPKRIVDDYGIAPKDYFKVTLKRTPKDTEPIIFAKKVSKCGPDGIILYVPKDIAHKHNLQKNMSFWVTLKYVEETV